MKKTLPLLCLLLLQLNLNAQQVLNTEEILTQGVELQKEKRFSEAIDLYRRIPVNDSNYYAALYETGNCYYLDSQFSKALEICKQAISKPNSEKPSFYNLAGNILDDMGNPQQAIAWYDSAVRAYPNYISPYLNKATVLFKQKKYREGELFLQKAAMLFPFNSSIHYKLGIAAVNQGKLIEGFLSLSHSVFVDPSGVNMKNAVAILSEMSKGTDDMLSYYHNRKSEPSENYNLVEQLFIAKTALDKNFKLSTGIEDPITRQMQMIIEKMDYTSDDNDFYIQYYLPVLKKMLEEKQFDHYCNYMFSGLEIPQIRGYNQKNKKDISEMVSKVVAYYNPLRVSGEIMMSLRSGREYYHFENNLLVAKGLYVNEKPVGDWEFCYRNGNTKSKGKFDEEGRRSGEWIYYYETSQISGKEHFIKGELHGPDTEYDINGTITSASTFSNGLKQGENHDYFPNGNPKSIEVFTDGKENGLLRYFHNSGGIKAEIQASNGLTHGDYTRYYENGRIETEGRFEEGKQHGLYRFYYDNGQLSSEGEYVADKQSGRWKNWHRNGQLKSELSYTNGEPEGEYTEFHDNGQLYYKQLYKKGRIDGEVAYFTREGTQHSIIKFVNGKLREAKYFDQTGKLIEATEVKNKAFSLVTWRIDGSKKSETHYNEKGNADGKEVIYWGSGKVYSCSNYKDGQLDGPCAFYFTNGKKEQEIRYTDGSRNGPYRQFYQHGQLAAEGWYKNDLQEGQWVWYNENGTITEKVFFTEGQKNGIRESWYPDGRPEFREEYIMNSLVSSVQYDSSGTIINQINIKQGNGVFTNRNLNCVRFGTGTMHNGVLDGPYTTRFFNNRIHSKEFYYHGLPDSSYERFYANGNLNQKGSYYRGEKTGVWTSWYESGALYSTEEYVRGELHGKKIYYHENGKPEVEIPYFHGKKEGWQNRFNENGELMLSIRYFEEMPLEYRYLGPDNNPVAPVPLKGGTGKIKAYYPNGQVSAEFEFSHGDFTGDLKYYHSNGQLTWESNEDYDMTEGLAKKYYPSGTPAAEYIYLHNNLHGPAKEWYSNGKLKEEGSYHLGFRHGDWKLYDQNGNIRETNSYYFGRLTNIKMP